MSSCKVLVCILVVLVVHNNLSAGPTVAALGSIQLYGEVCSEENDCDEGMYCISGVCSCSTSSVISRNKRRCLPVVFLNDVCEEDVQCTGKLGIHSRCHGFKCSCEVGTTEVNNACEKMSVDGDLTCDEDFQCSEVYGDNSICVHTTCSCKPGHHMHFHQAKSEECLKNTGLGDGCLSDDDCFLPMDNTEQHITCLNNVCGCVQGYSPSDGSNTCSKNVPSGSNQNTLFLISNLGCSVLYVTFICACFSGIRH